MISEREGEKKISPRDNDNLGDHCPIEPWNGASSSLDRHDRYHIIPVILCCSDNTASARTKFKTAFLFRRNSPTNIIDCIGTKCNANINKV